MIAMLSLWTAALASLSSVTGLSVQPVDDRTTVVIEVEDEVSYNAFTLADPHRLVVDITGARQALARDRFMDIDRGGVTSLRVSQFQPEVVRVVVDLTGPVAHSIEREDREIRVSFPNPGDEFVAWSTGAAPRRENRASGGARVANGDERPEAEPAPELPHIAPVPAMAEMRPISVYFRDTPVLDVLAHFAEFSGRSIVSGRSVDGAITADIRDQPWDVALEVILTSHGLAAQEMESGIIRVDKLSELREIEAAEPLITERFQIKYGRADSAFVHTVQGLLRDSAASVTANPSNNTVVVTDRLSSVRDRIGPMINQLDVRTPQVTINARIVFVDRTSLEELGIVYDLKDSRGNQLNQVIPGGIDLDGDGIIGPDEQSNQTVVRLGGASIAALANANERVSQPSFQLLSTLVLGRHSLVSFIDALSEHSMSEMQAMPMIRTVDHREASVQVGEETPVRVIDAGSGMGGGGGGQGGGQQGPGGMPRATVDFKNTGIILRVTPRVAGDQVMLELHAENSSASVGPSDVGVFFTKQEAVTQLLLDNGETGVVGGLTVVDESWSRTGIPLLMNIPGLGALFRTTRKQERKQDLLIMVTPHIIEPGER